MSRKLRADRWEIILRLNAQTSSEQNPQADPSGFSRKIERWPVLGGFYHYAPGLSGLFETAINDPSQDIRRQASEAPGKINSDAIIPVVSQLVEQASLNNN